MLCDLCFEEILQGEEYGRVVGSPLGTAWASGTVLCWLCADSQERKMRVRNSIIRARFDG
jgi:hypothetical protein